MPECARRLPECAVSTVVVRVKGGRQPDAGGPPGAKPLEPQEEYKRLEVALNCAEDLIRKKRGYGTELEENADNLVYGLVALQDNFDLEGFEEKGQGALTALVACCPRKAAP